VLVLVAMLAMGASSAAAQPDAFVPGQLLVKFKPATTAAEANALRASVDATVERRFATIDAELWDVAGIGVPDAVSRLKRDRRIAFAEPNYIVRAVGVFPDDPRFGDMWNLHNNGQAGGTPDADIDAPEAWSTTTGGDVLVGVIDTGVDWQHVDLSSNIFVNPGEIPGNHIDDDHNGFVDDVHGWDFVNEDNDPDDDNGHGTHVAGTIAAIGNNGVGITGVSWSARILPIKFLGSIGTGSTADAIRAVEYATAMGARLTNNSWGGISYSQALSSAIEAAGFADALFVAASGNAGINSDVTPFYPASFDLDNVIAVASTDRNDQRSSFSNFGAGCVDLGAPGSEIISLFPGDRYAVASGTSMAAPHVSGAACLMWAASPALTYREVKDAIMTSVDKIPALSSITVSGGRLNVDAMLATLDHVPPAVVNDLAVVTMGSNTARLQWSASGDDGLDRTASRYDLRYSTAPIDANNFASATPVAGLSKPKAPGSPESFQVTRLAFSTTYYFALVVEDDQGNRSPVSNVVDGTTSAAPSLEFAPPTFAVSLLTGGRSVQTLAIRNTTQGTLDFTFAGASVGRIVDEASPPWLSVDPMFASVPAGGAFDVDVIVDATRMAGGDYIATLDLRTNDPDHLTSPVPVSLRVTSAPDLSVAPSALDFGVRYTGTCTTDTVVVSNIGTATLTVSGVALTNPEYATDPAGFVLGAGESRALAVAFCPASGAITPTPRPSDGDLVLASDDPDHPTVSVPLSGAALDPPVVSVTPAAFDESMFTGGVATRTLTVSNDGVSELDFELTLEELGVGAAHVDVIADPSLAADVVAAGRPLSQEQLDALESSVPHSVRVESRDGLDQGRTSRSHTARPRVLERVSTDDLEEVFGSDANEFLGGAHTRGNLFACTTPTTLLEHRFYMNPTTATQAWFVVYEGEEASGVFQLVSASNVSPAGPGLGWYSSGRISVPLRAGKFYLIATAFEDATSYYNQQNISPYPMTTSFGQLTAGAGWSWQPYNQLPPAPLQFVTPDAYGAPVAYYQTLVTGSAIRWVSIDRKDGALAPGTSLDIAVRFDAAGVQGGDYDANVRVASNDPVTPEVVVPAHLHVTGAPDIAFADTALDFGNVFIGTTAQDTLIVSNTGTDYLFVSSITSNLPDYTVDTPSFFLTPGTRKLVVVTFNPMAVGRRDATLSVASIDPDEGLVSIDLQGEGSAAPVVAISPPSLSVDVAAGETSSPLLTISNSGGSDLAFEIDTGLNATRTASMRVSIPRSTGDFPRGEAAASIGRAPATARRGVPSDLAPTSAAPPAGFAFATETQNLQATRLDLDAPERLDFVGLAPDLIWAGDFGVGDNSFAYAVNERNQFVTIDTLTGAQTLLGTLVPFGTEVWSGMALDPTDGTMYATSTNALTSSLYVIDVDVPSATRVGAMLFPSVVALAVDDDGAMFALDVIRDELVAVDKTTGAGTTIGSIGFDSNFGQGMAFDPASKQLYISAFNNFRFQSELRIADRTTGATDVVGVLGGIDPGGLVQLGWLGIPGLGGVPWLRANPRRGVVPPGASFDVAVRFDASKQNGGDYDATVRLTTNDPAAREIDVPAHMHVTGTPDVALSAASLDFGVVFIGGSAQRTLVVSNVGTDVLHVGSVVAGGGYGVDGSAFTLSPEASREIVVTLAPSSTGPLVGTLTITSDDPDEGTVDVMLQAEGREPPVMVVTPSSFDVNLLTGQRVVRPMTIDNSAGASDLVWNATTRFPGDTLAVSAKSPVHAGRAAVDPLKTAARPARARPDARAIFAFDALAGSPPVPVDATSLETILASLDANFGDVTAAIPNRFDFFDGKVSDGILDGGYDMYDGGNYLSTNLGGTIPYSDGVVTTSPYFGSGGRYFTRKYPGLFVLVADLDGVDDFEINGNLGADGGGSVDGAILEARTAGADFRGFAKRVYGAGDPSVNHLVIVQENDAASHEFAIDTNSDYQRAFNLSGSRRLYYVLYAGWDGAYIDDAATLTIMSKFLAALGLSPRWVRVSPGAGVVPAGGRAAVDVTFDAAGLAGDYAAQIVMAGNDPVTPEIAVPAAIHVGPASDIVLSSFLLHYPPTFVGASVSDTLVVSNAGSAALTVTSIAADKPDYTTDASNFALAPGASRGVVVTFAPTTPGQRAAMLSIASNDPDQGVVNALLLGDGLDPPVISFAPAVLADTLVSGDQSHRSLVVSNEGGNAMEVIVSVAGARAGAPPSSGGGGPDFFGYRWEDNHDPDGPAFDWSDASGGVDIALSGDDFVAGIPLGFTFRYYGADYTTIGVASNGWLSFNGSGTGFPTLVPHPDFFAGVIAPYARHLAPPGGGYVRHATIGAAPDRRFVVEYHQVPDFGDANANTFEVILYERTNAIRFQYLVAPNVPEGFGMESPDESLGLGNGGSGDAFIDPARVADGYAIEFIAPPSWLHVEPTTASIPPSGNVDFAVTMDAAGLAEGRYDARLSVHTNDPVTPVVVVPVTLFVPAARATAGVDARAIPNRYALLDNRPNPFNPTTTIAYDLPRDSRVRLVVYDVHGKPVRELVSANEPAGRHQVAWDGRNQQGQPVASGVYFYRLAAGDFVATKKMVLLK
jgi:subtilisin family serine protease